MLLSIYIETKQVTILSFFKPMHQTCYFIKYKKYLIYLPYPLFRLLARVRVVVTMRSAGNSYLQVCLDSRILCIAGANFSPLFDWRFCFYSKIPRGNLGPDLICYSFFRILGLCFDHPLCSQFMVDYEICSRSLIMLSQIRGLCGECRIRTGKVRLVRNHQSWNPVYLVFVLCAGAQVGAGLA